MVPDLFHFQRESLEEQMLYQMILYLPQEDLRAADGTTIGFFLDSLMTEGVGQTKELLHLIRKIMQNRPDLAAGQIDHASWADRDGDGKANYPEEGLIAYTVRQPQSNSQFVVFRGTPKGAWLDNAKMLIGDPADSKLFTDEKGNTWNFFSPMQAMALEYIKSLIERSKAAWKQIDHHYVIGHSKGGNQAQLVGMLYEPYFRAAISWDGPGMSKAAATEMQKLLHEKDYQNAIRKLYAVNASNDFIHGFGDTLVPKEHTVWLDEYRIGLPLLGSHSLQALMDPQTGQLAPFTMEQGPVADFSYRISSVIMSLSPKEKKAVLMSTMGFAQVFVGKSFPVDVRNEEWLLLIRNLDHGTFLAIGIMLCVLMNTVEGKTFFKYLEERYVKEYIEEFLTNARTWYQSPPFSQQSLIANGIAGLEILRIIAGSVLLKTATMAEILEALRGAYPEMERYGKAATDSYIHMTNVLVEGYFYGVGQLEQLFANG